MRYFPWSNTFAGISILGLTITTYLIVADVLVVTWGTLFLVFFLILFIVTLVTLKPTVYERT